MSDKSKTGYNRLSQFFHWATALLIFITVPLGFYMVWIEPSSLKFDLYQWHKSVGMTILLLVILRIGWRFAAPPPPPSAGLKGWEQALSRAVHVLLYLVLFLMPLTGWLMTSASQFPNKYFGLFDIPDLVGKDQWLFEVMRESHEIIAFIIFGAVALHVAGALKHYIIDRDNTLQRMLPADSTIGQKAFTFAFVAVVFFSFAVSGMIIVNKAMSKGQEKAAISPVMAGEATSGGEQGQWTIIKDESRIGFAVDVYGKPFEGEFNKYEGSIRFDPDNLDTASAEFTVHIDSVESGSAERDGYIVEKPWLHADQYPVATFSSTSFEKGGRKDFVVKGDFTLRGQTQPVSMPFNIDITRDNGTEKAVAKGRFTIERVLYNIGQGEWAQGDTVGDTVKIYVELTADKQSASEFE